MASVYTKGGTIRISAVFADANGNAADPSAVTLKTRDPFGVISTLTYGTDVAVVKDSTGNYHADLTVSQSGRWSYRWQGAGAVAAAGEGYFDVANSPF